MAPRSDFEGYLLTSKIKTAVLNKTVALTCIFLFYVCNLHAYQYLHFDKIISTVFTDLIYINKGDYTKEGRETSMSIVMNDQYRSWLNRRHVYETILWLHPFQGLPMRGLTKLLVLCGLRITIVSNCSWNPTSKHIDSIFAHVPNGISYEDALPGDKQ